MQQPHILNDYIEIIYKKLPEIKNFQWEIYFSGKKSFSVEGKDLNIDKKKNSAKEFFSVRVIKQQKAGTSTCSSFDKLIDAFASAIQIAEISEPDEFLSLPSSRDFTEVVVFDADIFEVKNSLSALLIDMQKAAFFDKRIKKLRNAEISITIEDMGIINSNGISIFHPFTTITAHIIAIAEDKSPQMAWSYRAERFFRNINVKEVGREAGQKALMLLNPEKIKSFKGFAVFDTFVATEFVELLSQSLSAENYLLGRSLFIGKMNEQVINPLINIIDDGTIPEKFGSTPFDGEGVPTSRKILIEKGMLKSLMHNTYTAKRMGTSSTGNAVRLASGISVGPTNFYIDTDAKKYSKEELIKNVDKGVYITEVMGMHTANPVSGDFSVGISGVYIENGELKYPVKEAVISGNVLEVFKNIVALGNDLRFYGNIGSPSFLVEGVDISG